MKGSVGLSPEGFRTAAYLEARARMDFVRTGGGKTNRNVKCKPPNTKCGGRCIPAAWDCRLKGEGSDPHLSAKKFDPVSGIANLERGVKRLGRFTTTGSFSELESAKRSLIRGSVKLKPGNLKEKEEFKTWLENNYLKVAVPAALASAGVAAHVLFKKGNTFGYRYGAGRKVDEAVTNGVNAVLDRVPGLGASRSYTRKRGENVVSSINASAQLRARQGGQALTSNLGRGTEAELLSTEIPRSWASGNHALNIELNRVARRAKGAEGRAGLTFYNWNTEHRVAFWSAKVKGQSIYAEPAAQSFLKKEFRLQANPLDSDIAFKNELALMFERQQGELVDFAKLNNYRIQRTGGRETVHFDDRVAFIERYTRNIGNEGVRNVARTHVESLLTSSPASRAKSLYNETVSDYDQYFSSVSRLVTEIGGAPDFDAEMRRRGLPAVRAIADRRRINYLMSLSTKPRRDSAGPAHDSLFMLDYYHTRVVGSNRSTYSAPNNTILNAARELEGREFDSLTEAIGVLQNSHGFRGLQVESRNPFQRESMNAPRRRAPRRGKRLSREELISTYERAGLSREAAERAADKAISERGDANGSPNPRVDAYLETRARLDKRCGKSGIPDTKKCSKPTPAQSAEAHDDQERRDFTPTVDRKGKPCGKSFVARNAKCSKPTTSRYAQKPAKNEKENPSQNKIVSTIGKVALTTGLVAGSVYGARSAIRNRQTIAREFKRRAPDAYKRLAPTYRQYRELARVGAPVISDKIVRRLSSTEVEQGLSRLPKPFQNKARRLVGVAKLGAAHMSLRVQGYKVVEINNKDNFSTFKNSDGNVASIGAVGNNLLTFNSVQHKRKARLADNREVDVVGVQFMVNQSMSQNKNASQADRNELARQTKAMFNSHLKHTSADNIMYSVPFKGDARGQSRSAAYQRWNFTKLPGLDNVKPWDTFNGDVMFALKSEGKVVKMSDDYKHYITNVLATLDGSKYRPDRVSRAAATAKPYKSPKVRTSTGTKASTNVKIKPKTNPKEWSDLPSHPHLDERHRERPYSEIIKAKPVDSDTLSARFDSIKKHQGVEATNVDKLVNFVRKNNVQIDHDIFETAVKTSVSPEDKAYWQAKLKQVQSGYSFSGMYFQAGTQDAVRNKIYVSPKRQDLNNIAEASQDAVRTVNEFMDNVANHNVPTYRNGGRAKNKEGFLYSTTYNSAVNGDAHDLLVATHEIGHAVHEKAGFKKLEISGTVEQELSRVSSAYGLSDLATSQKELFAELFVLYTYSGKRLRQEAPAVYGWIDAIADAA